MSARRRAAPPDFVFDDSAIDELLDRAWAGLRREHPGIARIVESAVEANRCGEAMRARRRRQKRKGRTKQKGQRR